MIKNTVDLSSSEEITSLSSDGNILQTVTIKEDFDYDINTFDVVNVANGKTYKELQGEAIREHVNNNYLMCVLTNDRVITYKSYNESDSRCSVQIFLNKLNDDGDLEQLSSVIVQLYSTTSDSYTLYTSGTRKCVRVSDNRCYFYCSDTRSAKNNHLIRIDVNEDMISANIISSTVGSVYGMFELNDNTLILISYGNSTTTWRKLNLTNDSLTTMTFSGSWTLDDRGPRGPWRISDTAFLALQSNSSDEAYYCIYDVSDTSIAIRSTTGWYATEYGKIRDCYPIGNGLVLTCGHRGGGFVPVITVLDCNGVTPTLVKQEYIYDNTDWYSGTCFLMETSAGHTLIHCGEVSGKYIVSNVEVSEDGSTLTWTPVSVLSTDITNFDSWCYTNGETILVGAGKVSYSTVYYENDTDYYLLRPFRGTYVNQILNKSTQAIALASGSAGDEIKVIFSGEVKANCATGLKITSTGVTAACNIDGKLTVKGHWEDPNAKIKSSSTPITQSIIVKEDADYNIDTFDVVNVENGIAYKALRGEDPYVHSNSHDVACRLTEDLFVTYESYTVTTNYYGVLFRLKKLDANGDCSEISSTIYEFSTKKAKLKGGSGSSVRISDNKCYFTFEDNSTYDYLICIDLIDGKDLTCTAVKERFTGNSYDVLKLNDNCIIAVEADVSGNETWYKINPQDNSMIPMTFSGTFYSSTVGIYRISDTAFLGCASSSSSKYNYRIYDVSGTTITQRGSTGITFNSVQIQGCCELWDGLVLIKTTTTLYVYDCNGTDPVQVNKISTTQTVDDSYSTGNTFIVKNATGVYCIHKDLPTKRVLLSEVIVSNDGSTMSLETRAILRNDDSYTTNLSANAIAVNDTIMIGIYNSTANYGPIDDYILLRKFRNIYCNKILNESTHAIALNSGNPGDRINVIFSGEIKANCATGFKVISDGVTAVCNVDGKLKVKGHWENIVEAPLPELAKVEIGSYVGTGASSTITLNFNVVTPKMVIITGNDNRSTDDYTYADGSYAILDAYGGIVVATGYYSGYSGAKNEFAFNRLRTTFSGNTVSFSNGNGPGPLYIQPSANPSNSSNGNTSSYHTCMNESGITYTYTAIG